MLWKAVLTGGGHNWSCYVVLVNYLSTSRDVPVIHPVPGKCRISHYSVLPGPGKIMGPSSKKKIFFNFFFTRGIKTKIMLGVMFSRKSGLVPYFTTILKCTPECDGIVALQVWCSTSVEHWHPRSCIFQQTREWVWHHRAACHRFAEDQMVPSCLEHLHSAVNAKWYHLWHDDFTFYYSK